MDTNSSTSSTPGTPGTPKTPKNPARGNKQGQTTFAAKIDRWEAMINNLEPELAEMPNLRPAHAALQQTIADAKALRDHLKDMTANVRSSTGQRKDLVAKGEDLFSLLSHGLRFALGPDNQKLAAFAVKPRKRTGRPHKTTPPPITPIPEAPTAPHPAPVTAGAPAGTTTK